MTYGLMACHLHVYQCEWVIIRFSDAFLLSFSKSTLNKYAIVAIIYSKIGLLGLHDLFA